MDFYNCHINHASNRRNNKMTWRHYKSSFSNEITAINDGNHYKCKISIGGVFTGKQKVFVGYYCQIECNGLNLLNEHNGSLYLAFLATAREFLECGYSVNLYGLQSNYRESGLSENSGFGYVSDISSKPFLMIDELLPHAHVLDMESPIPRGIQ